VRPALILLAAAAAVRLLVAAFVPLVPDEAYYWEWSRHLAAGYFDHPPVIAWLIRAGTVIGGATAFGVRAGPIVAGFLGSCAAAALANRLGGPRGAWRLAVLLAVVPLAGVGLILATPDAPLLACSALMLWAIDHALDEAIAPATVVPPAEPALRAPGPAIGWWVAAGAALGCGASSKYTVVLIPAAVLAAFAMSPALRAELWRPGPYLACGVAACVFFPVVAWNAHHDWVSFRFQLHHGLGPVTGPAFLRELALAGAQAGLVSPVLFVLAVGAAADAVSRRRTPRRFVLAVVAVFVWAFFAVSAIRRPVEANWPAIAALPALVLLATWMPGARRARWERIGVALGGAMVLAIYVLALFPVPLLPARADPLARAFGWDELASAVAADRAHDSAAGSKVWLAADRYQDAAELAFNMPGHPTVFSLNLAGRPNQYDLWPTARDSMRRGDALTAILDDVPDPPPPVAQLSPHFSHVERGALVELHRGGHVVARRRLWHFLDLATPL
jgi:4-amino-4-deoxy-L-arabinose transferase-like glycosyltransferase